MKGLLLLTILLIVSVQASAATPLIISFDKGVTYTAGHDPSDVAIGDFRSNTIMDLAVVNNYDNTVSIFLGNGDGTFQAKQDYATCTGPTRVVVADMNQDKKPDLVVMCPQLHSASMMSVLLGNGDGTFQAHTDYTLQIGAWTSPTDYYPRTLLVGNLNGDGYPDVVTLGSGYTSGYQNGVHVLLNAGAGQNGALQPVQLADSTLGTLGVLADVNGDTKPDLVYTQFIQNVGPNGVAWAFGDGAGNFTNDNTSLLSTCQYGCTIFQNPVVGDVKGDGHADVVVATATPTSTSADQLCVIDGDGLGNFAACTKSDLTHPSDPDNGLDFYGSTLAIGDLNNSGREDLVAEYTTDWEGNCSTVTVGVMIGHGDGLFQAGPTVADRLADSNGCGGDSGGYSVAIGDLNGDGLPDIVVNTGVDIVVYLNTSSVLDQAPVASNASAKTQQGVAYSGTLTASQSQANALYYEVKTKPAHGTLQITDASTGTYTYTPDSSFSGTDSFTFDVNDGYLGSNTATVSLTTYTVPIAKNDSVATTAGVAVSGRLLGSDPGNNPLTFKITQNGAKGTARITNASTGAYTYTPSAGQTGQDTFTYQVSNGYATASATVTVFIGAATSSGSGGMGLFSLFALVFCLRFVKIRR